MIVRTKRRGERSNDHKGSNKGEQMGKKRRKKEKKAMIAKNNEIELSLQEEQW